MEQKMLNNFIKKYGHTGLERISELFLLGESNQVIAKEFNVTRQRVHQWQKAFIEVQIKLKPMVATVLTALDTRKRK